MPRSVNSVAKRARRKKILKQAKGYLGVEKMYGLLLKMQLKKDFSTPTETEELKKEVLDHCG